MHTRPNISGATRGPGAASASPGTPGTTATDPVPFIRLAGIVGTFATAKTTPFVTRPTESALAPRGSSEISKIRDRRSSIVICKAVSHVISGATKSARTDFTARDASTSVGAKMAPSECFLKNNV